MNKYLKKGDLVKVKQTLTSYQSQYGVILKYTHTAKYNNANFYQCLLNNKIDIVSDAWIESIL